MSGEVRVDQVPIEDGAIRAWYDVMAAAERQRPLFTWPPVETALRMWLMPRDDLELRFYLAARDGEIVGAGRLELMLRENRHLGQLKVFVPPPHRGTGVGTAVLEHLEREGTAAARTAFLTEVCTAPDDAADPALGFAAARGYTVAGRMQLKSVDLPATADRLPALEALAAERLGDYRLVSWLGATPDEHLDSMCHLYTRFLAEIPLEDIALQPQAWDADRLRATEARRASSGVRSLTAAVQAPDGTLVANSEVRVSVGNRHADLGGTLVLPEHRGHRLGLAAKVLLHQQQLALLPDIPVIVTGNAGVNQWMNAINEQLGYTVVEDLIDVQKVVTP